MENRLEQLLAEKPDLLERLTKISTLEETLEILNKDLDHYSKAELHNDLVRLKNGKFTIGSEEELNIDQLEQVAGGAAITLPSRLTPEQKEKLHHGVRHWLAREKNLGLHFL